MESETLEELMESITTQEKGVWPSPQYITENLKPYNREQLNIGGEEIVAVEHQSFEPDQTYDFKYYYHPNGIMCYKT